MVEGGDATSGVTPASPRSTRAVASSTARRRRWPDPAPGRSPADWATCCSMDTMSASIDHTAESIDLKRAAQGVHRSPRRRSRSCWDGRRRSPTSCPSNSRSPRCSREIDLEQGQANAVAAAVELATARVDLGEAGPSRRWSRRHPPPCSTRCGPVSASRRGHRRNYAGIDQALPLIVVAVLVLLWVTAASLDAPRYRPVMPSQPQAK